MIGNNRDTMSWRDHAMARAATSAENHTGSMSTPVVEIRKAPLETSAWDPYEVWLTRVKQPRDAREQK